MILGYLQIVTQLGKRYVIMQIVNIRTKRQVADGCNYWNRTNYMNG